MLIEDIINDERLIRRILEYIEGRDDEVFSFAEIEQIFNVSLSDNKRRALRRRIPEKNLCRIKMSRQWVVGTENAIAKIRELNEYHAGNE